MDQNPPLLNVTFKDPTPCVQEFTDIFVCQVCESERKKVEITVTGEHRTVVNSQPFPI